VLVALCIVLAARWPGDAPDSGSRA